MVSGFELPLKLEAQETGKPEAQRRLFSKEDASNKSHPGRASKSESFEARRLEYLSSPPFHSVDPLGMVPIA